MEIVEELFIAGKILSGCNSSFITLILMVDSPIMVTNFRLISLIGTRYKIIMKVMASRFVKVIDSIVRHEKLVFFKHLLQVVRF